MFVWKNGDLNPEQENAIFYEDSVLLVACPGSGKTRTLTYKIAYELSKLNSNKQPEFKQTMQQCRIHC